MTAAWKLAAEARMMDATTPIVLKTNAIEMIATSSLARPPSRATFNRWIKDLVASAKLRPVIKGIYLNRLGHRDASPAAAARSIRSRSIVSLAWVLEQTGATNNIGDTITCVIPVDATWSTPQISDRKTAAGTFRFFTMPAHLTDERAGRLEDIRDLRFEYQRTTAEKALLDWIYLGASARSRMTRPPPDLQIDRLSRPRLKRLAANMKLSGLLDAWLSDHARFHASEDVRNNASTVLGF